jgi:hypothetical protein
MDLEHLPWVLRRVSEADRRAWIEATFIARTADSPLTVMHAMTQMRELLLAYERAAVEEARERGSTWDEIGEALGRTRQSVHRQFKN